MDTGPEETLESPEIQEQIRRFRPKHFSVPTFPYL